MQSHTEPFIYWSISLGLQGSKKSPVFQMMADMLKKLENFDKNLHEEEKKNEPKEEESKSKRAKTNNNENCYQRLVMYCTRQGILKSLLTGMP